MDKMEIEIEKLSPTTQRRRVGDFNQDAFDAFPKPQKALLAKWLKSSATRRSWDGLLRLAESEIELAEALAQSLFECGAADREEELKNGMWRLSALTWRNYEAICSTLGLATRNAVSAAATASWLSAQQVSWQRPELIDAYQALQTAPPEKSALRLALLIKLNDWLVAGKSGNRRDFSQFAYGQSKQLSVSEWSWLHEVADLDECGIERHEPTMWIAGDAQLKLGKRTLDLGAAGDFMALTTITLGQVSGGKTSASHYRLVENRACFERLVRKATDTSEILLWLPGYAPTWWRNAMTQLLTVMPLPARISCDADPEGVQIALSVAEIFFAKGLQWEPWAMGVAQASNAERKLPLTERDNQLAESLLAKGKAPAGLVELLQWCLSHRSKAEQENWL